MLKYEPLFEIRSAMSQSEIFHKVADRVIPLVADHPHGWKMNRHFHPEREVDRWCPCCLLKYQITVLCCGVCESCATAWVLSIVSKSMRDRVMANGRSWPRWMRWEISPFGPALSRDGKRRKRGLRDGEGEEGYQPDTLSLAGVPNRMFGSAFHVNDRAHLVVAFLNRESTQGANDRGTFGSVPAPAAEDLVYAVDVARVDRRRLLDRVAVANDEWEASVLAARQAPIDDLAEWMRMDALSNDAWRKLQAASQALASAIGMVEPLSDMTAMGYSTESEEERNFQWFL